MTAMADMNTIKGSCFPMSEHIHRQLRKALKARGWRAVRLCRELGIAPSAISKLKDGRKLEFDLGMAICRKLDIPPEFLLSDADEVPPSNTPEERIVLDAVFGPGGCGLVEAVRRLLLPGVPAGEAHEKTPLAIRPLGSEIRRGVKKKRSQE